METYKIIDLITQEPIEIDGKKQIGLDKETAQSIAEQANVYMQYDLYCEIEEESFADIIHRIGGPMFNSVGDYR